MGAGSAWGSREEFLHPRDSHGRFRSSWKMADGVVEKLSALLDKFNPRTFTSDEEAQQWVHSHAKADRFLKNRHAAIDRFLKNFSNINAQLEQGNTSSPDVKAIDQAMRPLPSDLILSRSMPPEAFGLNAQNIGQVEELTGKLISSKGFTSVSIGTPFQRQPGHITMTIATPAGTEAVVPALGRPSKELILNRDQPLRVTKVESDGQGGFNVLAVAAGDSEHETPVDIARAVPGKDVSETPEVPAAAPAPNAPSAAAPAATSPEAGAVPAAPVRTGRPGRPAGPPPPARNEGHVGTVGTGQAPAAPESAPSTPEAPSSPVPELPATPQPGPDERRTFVKAFEDANLKVPSVGTRRKQFEDAYRNLASGKKSPQETVADLDTHIAMNKRIIASDKDDGTDSGPLPEDVKRQQALRDLIAEHYNFTGRKTSRTETAPKDKTPAKATKAAAPKMSAEEADAKIAAEQRARKAAIRKEIRGRQRAQEPAAPVKLAEPSATEKARTETIVKSLQRAKEPKESAPIKRAQVPAKDLSDKGLLSRFEAEIKKDNPNEARLKELGDELDRRDLETANRVKGLSDKDLLKKFEAEIAKDNPDEEEMRRLGDELDRRDAEVAATQKKIDDLVAKGREYRDAYAEVHGLDPEKLKLEEKQALLDQSRRAGESREDTLRRMYGEHLHRQYLDAEAATRGHLLNPEGRRRGIDPKSLFSGNNVVANKWASDELKDYWEKNPRKTYVEFKADTLGKERDVKAAEKVRGVARNVELGEKLERRSPRKRAVPGAAAEAPQRPVGTPRAPERVRTPEAPQPPKPAKTEEVAGKPEWGTLNSLGVKVGDEVMYHGHDRRRMGSEGRRVRVEKGTYGGYSLVDAQTGEPVASFGSAGRNWISKVGSPEKPQTPKAPATPSAPGGPDIDKMTVAQLKDEAKRRGVKIPYKITRKADIQSFLRGEGGKTSDGDQGRKENVPDVGLENMTIAQIRQHAADNGLEVPRTLRLKKDIVNWTADALARKDRGEPPQAVPSQREIRRANIQARQRLRDSPAEAAARERGVARGSARVVYGDDLKSRLDAMTSVEQGDDLMVSMNPSRQELVDMAKSLNIAHPARANKDEIKEAILYWGLRRRLESAKIRQPGEAGRVLQNAMERPGPKHSKKEKLPNHWGMFGAGEVGYHEDGHVGMLVRSLGNDADLEVRGDRLDNVLGKKATDLVRGKITQQELIDDLRSLSTNFDANGAPDVAAKLRRTADAMDTPKIDTPQLPEGTPEPVRKLMDKLASIPLARSNRNGPTEIENLSDVMKRWEDGQISPLRLRREVENAVRNQRHESNEGKFEIDNAWREADDAIERMFNAVGGRDQLRPPSVRQAPAPPLPQRVPRESLDVKPDLSDASMPQLKAIAESEGVKVPPTLRSKADVAKFINDARSEKVKLKQDQVPAEHRAEMVNRLHQLRVEMARDPDGHIAVGFQGSPVEVIDNAIKAAENDNWTPDEVSQLLVSVEQNLHMDATNAQNVIREAIAEIEQIGRSDGDSGDYRQFHTVSQGVENLAKEVTPSALNSPETKREPVAGGLVGASSKITLPSGKQVFEKRSKRYGFRSGTVSSDSEQLLSGIGTSIGAPTMPTLRPSSDTIYTDWVGSYTPGNAIIADVFDRPEPGMEDLWKKLQSSDSGKVLGLLDLITFNGDRHPGNWGADEHGNLVAIDNGMGWGFTDIEAMDPSLDANKIDIEQDVFSQLTGRFLTEHYFDFDGNLKDNDLTLADIEKVRVRLEALREQFRHLNREKWLDLSLKALDLVKRHAKGKRDLIT